MVFVVVENAMTKFPAAVKPFLLYYIKKKNSALLIYPLFNLSQLSTLLKLLPWLYSHFVVSQLGKNIEVI